MPEQDTISLGGQDFAVDLVNVKKNVRRTSPKDPTKKVTVEEEFPTVTPILKDLAAHKTFIGAALDEAESRNPGDGVKLAEKLFAARVEAAHEAGFDMTVELAEPERARQYITVLVSPEPPRSAAMTTESINKEFALLVPELAQLARHMSDNESWKQIKDPTTGRQIFNDHDQFLLRFVEVNQAVDRLSVIQEARTRKQAENKAKRAAAAEAAKLAVAAKAQETLAEAAK